MFEDVEPGQIDIRIAVLGQPGGLAAMVDMAVGNDHLRKPGQIHTGPQEFPSRLGGRTGVEQYELISKVQGITMDRSHHIGSLDGMLFRYHGGDTIPIVSLSLQVLNVVTIK